MQNVWSQDNFVSEQELLGIAGIIECQCADANQEFLDCKLNNPDPASCVDQGTAVIDCVLSVRENARTSPLFAQYRDCLTKHNFNDRACSGLKKQYLEFLRENL